MFFLAKPLLVRTFVMKRTSLSPEFVRFKLLKTHVS
jgi:hypothetical protein